MKLAGFGAVACAAMLTIACAGDARNDRDDDPNRMATGTTGGDSSSVPDDNDALDTKGDAQARIGASVEEGESRIAVGTSGQAGAHGATGDARHFTQTMAMHGTAEVELGRLASERAQSPAVKEFAQTMVRDHTRANTELKQLAAKQNVDLSEPEMDGTHQQLMAKLRNLRGAEFDREYMKAMVEGHMIVRSLLESRTTQQAAARDTRPDSPTGTSGTAAATTQFDTAVNQWASRTLPAVEQHLEKAQQIQAGLGTKPQ